MLIIFLSLVSIMFVTIYLWVAFDTVSLRDRVLVYLAVFAIFTCVAIAKSYSSPRAIWHMAVQEDVPPRLALAIATVESNMDCSAPRGSSGEVGLMQVLPATAKSVGVERHDLSTCMGSIVAGVRYLRLALDKTEGDLLRAAYLYNAGVHRRPKIGEYGAKVREVLYGE